MALLAAFCILMFFLSPSEVVSSGATTASNGTATTATTIRGNAAVAGGFLQSGTCKLYGCKALYVRDQSCQCNMNCAKHGNCCHDYAQECNDGAPQMPRSDSCKSNGCNAPFMRDRSCQCNTKCVAHGNCCNDYVQECGQSESSLAPLSPATIYGHPSTSKTYPKYKGFTLWLVEEFDAPLDLDSDPIWTWGDGGLKEGQVRFVKEQITFGDGKMKILMKKNEGKQQPCSHAQSEIVKPKVLVSGELRTRYNMFRYGRYEVSMKAPCVQPHDTKINGNFVATVFIFRDASFHHWREIDVEVTGRRPGAISTNVLNANHAARWHRYMEETDYPTTYDHVNARADFHTYAFEWLPDVIRWYVDGKMIREKRDSKVKVPELSAKIMMNLWVYRHTKFPFGGFELKNDKFPMVSEYDWFRFYKWDGDTDYPPAGMKASALHGDDLYLTSNNPCDGIPQIGEVEKHGKTFKPCKATCR
eukprot:TRINITY_DN914_c0_g1_i8.p1 TRINITY_DN914_c0_g1~~TRINITY_DN914_c0_g1_i8.p1  ORF type:complete len:498 (-),score=78.02 TRINITY_DN914_c0_g1_i8:287-1705(-)